MAGEEKRWLAGLDRRTCTLKSGEMICVGWVIGSVGGGVVVRELGKNEDRTGLFKGSVACVTKASWSSSSESMGGGGRRCVSVGGGRKGEESTIESFMAPVDGERRM